MSNHIIIERYTSDPDKGLHARRHVGNKTIGEVFDELRALLEGKDLLPDEYFCICRNQDKGKGFPTNGYRSILCYAQPGGSEGHYVYVSVIKNDMTLETMYMGKCLFGYDAALASANACSKALAW